MKDIPDFSKIINKELLDNLTFDEAKYIWRLKELIEKKFKQEKIKNDFMAFVKEMWPEFIEGRHHKEFQKNLMTLLTEKLKD